jgi:hypothetical protein
MKLFKSLMSESKSVPSGKHKILLLSIFFISIFNLGYSVIFQASDSVITYKVADQRQADSSFSIKKTFTSEELIRGERLFYGLVYLGDKSINCAGCHNTTVSDSLNWNPDAAEISIKFLDKSIMDLNRALVKPSGKKLVQVHKEFQLTLEDIVMIKGYMDQLAGKGLLRQKPVITYLLLFIVASILILFSVIDLIITRKLKQQWINYIVILSAASFITYTLVVNAIAIGRSQNYSPDQPVKFSHAVHAGQNQTDCIYCHSSAPYSKSAGIPAENICMNCHLVVRNGTRSGAFEISKIISSYENQKSIEWIKIHNLPDHVFFSHAQHVSAGGVNCVECHGKVQEMNVVVQVKDLSMGWCVDCHRTRVVNFNNNKFYSDYKELAEKVRNGTLDSVTVEMIGGRECMKCHY